MMRRLCITCNAHIVGLAGLGYLARLNKAGPEISTAAVTSGRRIYVVLRRSHYVLA